jgi:hypothetical protein
MVILAAKGRCAGSLVKLRRPIRNPPMNIPDIGV